MVVISLFKPFDRYVFRACHVLGLETTWIQQYRKNNLPHSMKLRCLIATIKWFHRSSNTLRGRFECWYLFNSWGKQDWGKSYNVTHPSPRVLSWYGWDPTRTLISKSGSYHDFPRRQPVGLQQVLIMGAWDQTPLSSHSLLTQNIRRLQ